MKKLMIVVLWAVSLIAQERVGELRLAITDPNGLAVKSTVELVSEGNDYRNTFTTDDEGKLDAKRLPFGIYKLSVHADGFAALTQSLKVDSEVPSELALKLGLAQVNTTVVVQDQDTLVDTSSTGTVNRIGSESIDTRATSLPGQSLVELVDSQPGWLFEGNNVLHPRGAEYQTQFVVNGIPLTDNRSLGFAPAMEADDVQSMAVYTGGIPAEYGRKMGGVIEINTQRDSRQGLHGNLTASGGSFGMAQGYGLLQYGIGKSTFTISSEGAMTDRYLSPPVLQNYTNTGTTRNSTVQYEHDFSKDHLELFLSNNQAHFQVPNELVQQLAAQRQDRANFETMGIVSFQHVISANVLADLRAMVRDDTATLASNPFSTPIIANQNRGFREEYAKGSISVHHGRHELEAGAEADFASVHEAFDYTITDPSQFGNGTPGTFNFKGHGMDREQSAFVQDAMHLGNWSINAGLRWDHYQFLVDENAVSPRLGVGRYLPRLGLQLHASYDRVFQTPAFENILLSSSPQVSSLSNDVLRLPVRPSRGHYFEVGATKAFEKKIRLDVNYFRRYLNNFADDDLLLDTGVGFPIAWHNATIYGTEAKLELLRWGPVNGFVSYSYQVGSQTLPGVGGLFLGDNALSSLNGRFWVTQDQRHTLRTRFNYHVNPRFWVAMGATYGSGLPVEIGCRPGDPCVQDLIKQYGQQIVDQVNLDHGRVRPSYSLDFSSSVELYKSDKVSMRLQGDVENLTNRVNVMDFAGIFSGTAIAPSRSYFLRLETKF